MFSGGSSLVSVLCLMVVMPLVRSSIDDGVALIAVKVALNVNAPSWNNGTDPCLSPEWEHVFCGGDFVTKLNLSGQGLTGSIPGQIGDLSQLRVLDLQDNNLNSIVPAAIAKLGQHLQYLYLTRNNLTGPFPDSILQLVNLLDLRIDENNFVGPLPDDIRNLTDLTILSLGGNQFTGPIPSRSLGSLKDLTALEIWGNPFNDVLPTELGLLPNLTKLVMHNNGLNGNLPSSWSSNKALETLEMQWNNIEGSVPDSWVALPTLGSLKLLRLDHNRLQGVFPLWTFKIKDSTDLSCNYFTGNVPAGYNLTSWTGNCFSDANSDDAHSNSTCVDGTNAESCFSSNAAKTSKRKSNAAVIAVVSAVVVVLIVVGLLCLWRFKVRRNQRQKPIDQDPYSLRQIDLVPLKDRLTDPRGLKRFTLKELLKATSSFSKENEIGEGGFGKVYYAKLRTGDEVAIKKATPENTQGVAEFQNEITLLSQVQHPNLLGIKGFCDDGGEQILVYEFMKNGNLHDCLSATLHGATLNWHKRLEIASQIASGLHYLHNESSPRIIHRDVKPSNILLDGNLVARLSDFGISKLSPESGTHVSTRPAGTVGYLDPDYYMRRQLTTASDVYSFGVVLLELVTGQKAVDKTRGSEEPNLAKWVHRRLKADGVQAVIDPLLKVRDYPEAAYEKLAWLALDCSAQERDSRPSITVVLRTLEEMMKNLTVPATEMSGLEPGRVFYAGNRSVVDSSTASTSTTSSVERAATRSMSIFPR
eukprot:TRINITY_DN14826_c0_g1_i1.p1 TRINITY_DN14826_c0_g1~~TRINITY_DN14826_c0_g1_i1.p1  ORF type:complete len:756 (+),score=85.64 TRINITY_DN14826_c0_g1_i1:320-2587(+)